MEKVFVICVRAEETRDTQFFCPNGISDEEYGDEEFDPSGFDYEDCWADGSFDGFLGFIPAENAEEAVNKAALDGEESYISPFYGYDARILKAIEVPVFPGITA